MGHPAPDLWRYTPGDNEPELLFANPERDSVLALVEGDGTGAYAFVEQNTRTLGAGGWRLWYLAAGSETTAFVDEGDVADGLLPFFALSEDRIVWAVLHQQGDEVESQLIEMRLPDGEPRVLVTLPAVDAQVLYPSLDGDRLVYSVMTVNTEGTALTSEVFLIDLSAAPESGETLSAGDNAFMPVIHGDWVVWQRPLLDSPLNGGELIAYSLRSGERHEIVLDAPGTPLNYHTVGNRYVAAESEVVDRLYLYDLHDRQTVLIEDLGDAPEGERQAVDVRPRVAEDLLVFVRGSDFANVDLILKWAALPPVPAE